jgi:hypothetical protein
MRRGAGAALRQASGLTLPADATGKGVGAVLSWIESQGYELQSTTSSTRKYVQTNRFYFKKSVRPLRFRWPRVGACPWRHCRWN